MNWKSLKKFAIAVLLVMDIVFFFCVAERHYAVSYYDSALIDSAVTVFASSGISVDRSLLEQKKPKLAVYTGEIEEKAFAAVAASLGTETSFLGKDFAVSYAESEDVPMPSALLAEGIWMALPEGAEKERAFLMAQAFLETHGLIAESAQRYRYDVVCTEAFVLGGQTVVRLRQRLDGMLLEDGLDLYISEGRVKSAEGVFALLAPRSKKSTENEGVMSILFSEKAYIDALAEEERGEYTVSDISYSYGLYFDAEGTFYLIPLCKVSYQNGEVRIYNFVSGKLYS